MQENQKVAVICGVGGIGKAVVEAFSAAGYGIAVADLKVAPEIAEKAAFAGEFDITDEWAVSSFVNGVTQSLGRIDSVVITSGITRDGLMVKYPKGVEQTPENAILASTLDFDAVLKTHVYGAFYMARAVIGWLIKSKGSLAFTSSIVARDGNIGQVSYTAAKCALEGMSRTISREVSRFGVRVNCVGPGFTDTPMIAKMAETEKGAAKLAELRAAGYIIQPETIAKEFLRLAEGEETGIVSYIDGGCKL